MRRLELHGWTWAFMFLLIYSSNILQLRTQTTQAKMSLVTKALSISLIPLFLSLIPLLHIKALALDTTSSFSLVNTMNVASNETDFHALLAFKSNIVLEYQQALSSWNESLHLCDWEGVKCGRRHKRVTILDLTARGLTGSLSPYIGNLSFLRELSLRNNTFTGEIPTELGNLFRLQKLDLMSNGFEGKIPTSISRCSNLRDLTVSDNKLVGEFPKELVYSMPKLVTLRISKNTLTGGIPPSIGNLTSLVDLKAAYNPLGGSIPDALGQLRNLNCLALGSTQISGIIPPSLYNLSLLEILSVSNNYRLRGSLPPKIGLMFPHLQVLQLYENQFNGPIPLSISNSSELERLELSDNNFNGKVRNDFGNLQNLWYISLGYNNFETKGSDGLAFLSSLTNCSHLKWVHFENSQFGGVLPDSVGNLSVTFLALDINQLYGSIPSTIGNLVNLEVLYLNNNLFRGSIPGSIGHLHKLQVLDFSTNNLSGTIPDSIGNLSLLINLYMSKNRLEGAIPLDLGNCQKLLELSLHDNNLNGSIPTKLLTVSSLSIRLDLARNRLSGSLPFEVGNLKHLAEIDISENGLSGEIPGTLGSCSSLENLYLHQNFFQGSIPSSMESLMRSIQNLDLSDNNLSGQIPRFLGTFSLKNLNLSFNNFEGELPMNGVFANASALSVAGNYRLCGGISELRLPQCTTKKSRNRKFLSRTLGITVASILVGVTVVSSFIICLFKKKGKTKPTIPLLKDSFLKVSYGELLNATEGFSLMNLLGFGSFGHVYRGVIEQNGELVVAVKVLDLQTRGATKSFMAECEALRNIRHRNLVSIITACSSMDFQGNEFKALVYEFMPNGSLDNWLHPIPEANNGEREFVGLDLLRRVDIAIDVACALDYLHYQCKTPIIHCDLKPSNILLDGDMVAHVGDFGLARFREEFTTPSTSSSTAIKGTIGYAAPEYGLGSEMSVGGDVYSYGILLLEMITRKRPTDKMFEADLNLHKFARIALPERVIEIVDPMLLTEETNGNKMMENLISLIKIGLACSTESPKDRMNISTALRELHLVKNNILKVRTSGTRSSHV